ncbi:TolB family protein [Krasilnikovia sp. MM14-A1259]|uniref:TolB family protein n=1 Tax=Krasilnikovia sp. MM14-A1259 TaxID=3373539 RepID=UPI00399D1A07
MSDGPPDMPVADGDAGAGGRDRARLIAVLAVTVVAVLGAVAYVVHARNESRHAAERAPHAATGGDWAAVSAGPHVAFRNTGAGADQGHVAVVPLTDPTGPRAITPASCDRLYATRVRAVCLSARTVLATRSYQVRLLRPDWSTERDLGQLAGLYSRTRLSPDAGQAAVTAFVYGDSYTSPGKFSTRTTISPANGGKPYDLETFALVVDGKVRRDRDRNFWGVTFADDDRFYATALVGGRTWLVQGSIAARRLTALFDDVECPSLSPDGTRIAYKKHGDLPDGQWRLTVLDLATGRQTPLAETRSIDDQPEWLDDQHVLYGLQSGPMAARTTDVWVADAGGGGSPRLFIPNAWSPTVVR